jgi:hypothetical protein
LMLSLGLKQYFVSPHGCLRIMRQHRRGERDTVQGPAGGTVDMYTQKHTD